MANLRNLRAEMIDCGTCLPYPGARHAEAEREDNNEVGRHVWDGQTSEGARDAVHGALVPRVLAAGEVPSCELLRELWRASQQHRCSRAVSARW